MDGLGPVIKHQKFLLVIWTSAKMQIYKMKQHITAEKCWDGASFLSYQLNCGEEKWIVPCCSVWGKSSKGRNKPENHHVFKFGSSNTLPQKNNFKRLARKLMVWGSCMERRKPSLSLAKANLSNFLFFPKVPWKEDWEHSELQWPVTFT